MAAGDLPRYYWRQGHDRALTSGRPTWVHYRYRLLHSLNVDEPSLNPKKLPGDGLGPKLVDCVTGYCFLFPGVLLPGIEEKVRRHSQHRLALGETIHLFYLHLCWEERLFGCWSFVARMGPSREEHDQWGENRPRRTLR